jgi:hypothetical protein
VEAGQRVILPVVERSERGECLRFERIIRNERSDTKACERLDDGIRIDIRQYTMTVWHMQALTSTIINLVE